MCRCFWNLQAWMSVRTICPMRARSCAFATYWSATGSPDQTLATVNMMFSAKGPMPHHHGHGRQRPGHHTGGAPVAWIRDRRACRLGLLQAGQGA